MEDQENKAPKKKKGGKPMPATKNLCAQISLELHQKISEAREESGLTTAQYITQLLTEYYEMKENGGKVTMAANNTRTMAFQIPETLFQRINVNAISKCRFSPKWDVVFYRAAYRCYTALYTTSLAGLKPVKP